jgi:uncharacterized coiled-coil protein SlyX
VMGYRREIRALNEAQSNAIANAKEESQRVHQERMTKIEGLKNAVSKNWEEVNKQIIADPKVGVYLTPKDGDEEVNKRLESGFKLVDEVMKQNAFDPNLTEEQRAKVIRGHAAVRARAAAFGRVRYELERERAQVKKLMKKLSQYESSTPPNTGDPRPSGAPVTAGSAKSRLEAELMKYAK